jgi:hypothetical protein
MTLFGDGKLHYRLRWMEDARTDAGSADVSKGVASWAAWESYYREASRRRRARGVSRTSLSKEKRRRRIRERLGIGASALLVAALTAAFYLVLSN